MPKTMPMINSLNAGELSPRLDFRPDLAKYNSGCRTLQGMIPLVEGGAIRVPGTYYVATGKTLGKKLRLVPFHFSSLQPYIIELGDQYIRFYTNDGQILLDASEFIDFNPTSSYGTTEKVRIGHYAYMLDTISGTKSIHVAAPYTQNFAAGTVKVVLSTYGSDSLLVVESPPGTIVIQIANGTASKNKGSLIQVAIRALGTVGGVDVSAWTVTENPAWTADRPIAAFKSSTNVAGGHQVFGCILAVTGTAENASKFPVTEPTYWTEEIIGDPVQISSPYLEADLFNLDTRTQSGDLLYIYHPSYAPRRLKRYGNSNWVLETIAFTRQKITPIYAASKTNPVKITTWPKKHGLTTGDSVVIDDVIGMTQLNGNTYTITKVNLLQFTLNGVDGTGYTAYASGGKVYRAGIAFDLIGHYPACGCFFDQRLVLAGTDLNPNSVYLSVVGDHLDFTTDPESDDAGMEFVLVSDRIDRIRWIIGQEFLFLGTLGGVWKLGASSYVDPLTQTNVLSRKHSSIGAAGIPPRFIGDSIVWITKSTRSVRQFAYDLQSDKWVTPDMVRLAKHITLGATSALSGIVEMDFQAEPVPILWVIRRDGVLLGMTFESLEQVYGWFRVVMPNAEVESVAVITKDNNEDQIWVSVKRTITGVPVSYYTGTAAVNGVDVTGVGTAFLANVKIGDRFKIDSKGTYVEIESVDSNTEITLVSAYPGVYEGNNFTIEVNNTVRRHIEFFKPQEFYSEIKDSFFVQSGLTVNWGNDYAITGITKAATAVVTCVGHPFVNGDKVRIMGVLGMTEVNIDQTTAYIVANKATNTFELSGVDSSAWTTYASGGIARKVANSVSGLLHLAGMTVSLLMDGKPHSTDVPVSVGGTLTGLSLYANRIHVGLPYVSIVEPMKISPEAGKARTKPQRINRLAVSFYETAGAKYGEDTANLRNVPFVEGADPQLFTEEQILEFQGDWTTAPKVCLVQDRPLPMTILGLMPRLAIGDEG
jgi:hypothetical protein